jgi:glutamyl-tRNA synthetase
MVRTRIAPSPTGKDLHIGNLYTALINWAFAKKNKGKFIVRIEDTDRQRLVLGAEQQILKTLKDFGLEPDEDPEKGGPFSPYRQSERIEIYQKYAHQLVEKGFAYYCTCSKERLEKLRKEQQEKKQIPRYDGHCRNLNLSRVDLENKKIPYVVRLKVPKDKKITVYDLIRGEIVFNSNNIDDQILLKSDGFPTYHLAVVIDDHLMQISHVIRAEEWLSSTPKHILLYQAFNWPLPVFCHLPILRNPNRSKLSKRKNPVWASWYLKEGFLPEAV